MTTSTMHHDAGAAQLAVAEYEAEQRRRHNLQQHRQGQLFALGRVFVATLFIASAIGKIVTYSATLAALADIIASPSLLLPIGIGIELAGGVMLLVGFWSRRVAYALIAYLATVTLLLLGDFGNPLIRSFALSNLAFAGALLMVAAHGAGPLSVDRATGKG